MYQLLPLHGAPGVELVAGQVDSLAPEPRGEGVERNRPVAVVNDAVRLNVTLLAFQGYTEAAAIDVAGREPLVTELLTLASTRLEEEVVGDALRLQTDVVLLLDALLVDKDARVAQAQVSLVDRADLSKVDAALARFKVIIGGLALVELELLVGRRVLHIHKAIEFALLVVAVLILLDDVAFVVADQGVSLAERLAGKASGSGVSRQSQGERKQSSERELHDERTEDFVWYCISGKRPSIYAFQTEDPRGHLTGSTTCACRPWARARLIHWMPSSVEPTTNPSCKASFICWHERAKRPPIIEACCSVSEPGDVARATSTASLTKFAP